MIGRHTLNSQKFRRYLIRERVTAISSLAFRHGNIHTMLSRWEGWKKFANVDRVTQRIRPRRFTESVMTLTLHATTR